MPSISDFVFLLMRKLLRNSVDAEVRINIIKKGDIYNNRKPNGVAQKPISLTAGGISLGHQLYVFVRPSRAGTQSVRTTKVSRSTAKTRRNAD